MATISMYTYDVKHGNEKIRYALGKQLPGDPVSVSELGDIKSDSIVEEFTQIRQAHKSKCLHPITEMIHSFSHADSKSVSPDVLNKIGHEIATTMFPGHQVLVVTHLDRDHYHNHIILNRHHMTTGKLARDNLDTLKKLRNINDRVCLSHGLSVLNQEKRERESKMPKKVADMIRHNRGPYLADMMQKCDFARSIATSYDQYQGILTEFGIEVRVEKKNISYRYPDRKERSRGKNMGKLYDKPGLEKAFQRNDERFQAKPALRDFLASKTREIKNTPGVMKTLAGELAEATGGHFKSGVKDYSKHTIVPRREARWARASDENLAECLVPIDELRKARRTNIIGYCKQNGIKLEETAPGIHQIVGRPYVEVSEYEWRNKKNNTRGNLIDLVAAHRQVSFLTALAEINGNKRLLLLQQEVGEVKRTYTSFYIPKGDRDQLPDELKKLGRFLESRGIKKDHANDLLKSGQAQVSKDGLIRLFGKDDEFGTTEYALSDQGNSTAHQRGQFTRPFLAKGGNGRKVNVFLDPFSFMRSRPKGLFPQTKESEGSLALMTPDSALVDQFLSGQRSVNTLRIVAQNPANPTKEELDFFGVLKNRYQQHGISIEFISIEKTLPGRGLGLER